FLTRLFPGALFVHEQLPGLLEEVAEHLAQGDPLGLALLQLDERTFPVAAPAAFTAAPLASTPPLRTVATPPLGGIRLAPFRTGRRRPPLRLGLEAQADAALVLLHAQDPALHFLAGLHDLLGFGNVVFGHLADVDQALDARFQLDERAERCKPDDAAGHPGALGVPRRRTLPGIRQRLLE